MSEDISNIVQELKPLDIRVALFKKRDFRFIVNNIAKNSEKGFTKGKEATHKKQEMAFKILTSNEYDQFLYGGAAGGAKSWTGVTWIVFMCLAYPNTKWFIARNELKDLKASVMETFKKVCREYEITDYKFNSVDMFIKFPNGSHINLIEVKYKPSDPLYEDIGSTEYTGGWVEEIGEIHPKAVNTLQTRTGRHMNDEYGIEPIVFLTCNPKQNWARTEFYDKHLNGSLYEENKREDTLNRFYLDCLVTENPFIEEKYINNLRKQASIDNSMFERLFKGNWDYEDNPNQIAEQEMIEQIFKNDHVEQGKTFLTADIARFGSDKAVIGVWRGWRLVEMLTYDISKTTDLQDAIFLMRKKYHIPKNRCIGDADGVGGGVIDNTGILGFSNNGTPIKEKGVYKNRFEKPEYKNLQVQCLYHLAYKINEGGIWIMCDLDSEQQKHIKQELAQIIRKTSDYGKMDLKPKSEIKKDIGRSPDYRDMLMMRVFFDLRGTRNHLVRRIPG